MQFPFICSFTLAVLAGSALAISADTQDAGSLANVEAPAVLEKRITPAILLLAVIGGKLFAGTMSAAIEVAKSKLAPDFEDWKDFDQAREAFMKENIQQIYSHREPGAKGVICINGPYTISPGASVQGPATEKFSWDIYHTTYDCFEVFHGSVTNNGDGGWINWASMGCPVQGKTMTC